MQQQTNKNTQRGCHILKLKSILQFKITLPNTDQAHEKHLWITKSNFSQGQLSTPWWWISHDPKHVGVIFNCLLKLTQRRF